jgi:hypothetical protein
MASTRDVEHRDTRSFLATPEVCDDVESDHATRPANATNNANDGEAPLHEQNAVPA